MRSIINESGPIILFILVAVLYPFAIKFIGGLIYRLDRRSDKHVEHRVEPIR